MAIGSLYSRLPGWLTNGLVAPLVRAFPEPGSASDIVDHAKRFAHAGGLSGADRYLSYVSSLGRDERRRLYGPELAARIDFDATDDLILEPFRRCQADSDLDRMLYCDLKTSLPDDLLALTDRMGMWHSLEVRVPLADHKLVELCAQIPATKKLSLFRQQKYLLRRIAGRWMPDDSLVPCKQGFESPMGSWLRRELKSYALDHLSPANVRRRGLFSPEVVSGLVEQHMAGKRKNSKILFSLLMLELWARKYQDLRVAA